MLEKSRKLELRTKDDFSDQMDQSDSEFLTQTSEALNHFMQKLWLH